MTHNEPITFMEWMSKTPEEMFGYKEPLKEPNKNAIYDDLPLNRLRPDGIMTELVRNGKVGNKEPRQTWTDVVEWGTEPGAIMTDLSPLGSFRMTIRRQIMDLEGTKVWICKKVHPLVNDYEGGNDELLEQNIADEVFEHVKQIEKYGIDTPRREFPEFQKLVLKTTEAIRGQRSDIFIFEGLKQSEYDPNHYIIHFGYRGHGVEAPGSARCEQFHIHMQFLPERGLIRQWGNEIQSKTRRHQWLPVPSEWDEFFTPSQPAGEIVESTVINLSVY